MRVASGSSSAIHCLDGIPNHEILGLGHLDQEAGKFPAERDTDTAL